MAAVSRASDLSLPLPTAALEAVARNAAEDAELTAALLDACGLRRGVPEGVPVRFPAAALLGIGVAMRLLAWETSGILIHREAGLPAAADFLRGVLNALAHDPSTSSPGAHALVANQMAVNDLALNRLAWEGPRWMGAEFVVGAPDGEDEEDAFVDALAQVLWANRHLGTHDETQTASY